MYLPTKVKFACESEANEDTGIEPDPMKIVLLSEPRKIEGISNVPVPGPSEINVGVTV